MLKDPIRDPKNTLYNLTFIFSNKDTLKSNIKSKNKFNNTIKSTYIFKSNHL